MYKRKYSVLIFGFLFFAFARENAAVAEPYEVFARYKPANGKDPAFEISIEKPDVLPRGSPENKLLGLFLRVRPDNVSSAALINFKALHYSALCQSEGCSTSIGRLDLKGGVIDLSKPPVEQTVIGPSDIVSEAHVETLTIRVQSDFDDTFLCSQERGARRAGKSSDLQQIINALKKQDVKPSEQPALVFDQQDNLLRAAIAQLKVDTKAAQVSDPKLLQSAFGGLDDNGKPVLWSFCDPKDEVNWRGFACADGKDCPPEKIESFIDRQRELVVTAVKEQISKKKAFAEIFSEKMKDGSIRVYVEARHTTSLVKEMGRNFALREEEDSGNDRPLSGLLDQDSSLYFRSVDPPMCTNAPGACDGFVSEHLSAFVESTDKKGNSTRKEATITPRGAEEYVLDASFRDFLDQDVKIGLIYKNNNHTFTMFERKTHVSNLGLITTAPVISEVVTLISKGVKSELSSKDVEFKSSIPISYAFGVGKNRKPGKHAAVTFPWMISYNFRAAPRFADVVKIFPHISAIFPLADADDQRTQVAFGAGLALANALALSWAIDMRGDNYVLVGISIPDLVAVVK